MSLKDTFVNAAEIAFKVFASLVKPGVYTYIFDTGFDKTETSIDVDVIVSSFSQKDIQNVSFKALIQPTDLQGLVKGSDLTLPVTTEGVMVVDDVAYGIVAFQTDPADALYILLLRKH